jgi:hypothetical protein
MRNLVLKTVLVVMVVLLPASAIVLVHGQKQATIPAQVQNLGMLDADGSALYSILFYSGPEALSKLTVTGSLPINTRSVEVVIAPSGARFVGGVGNKPDLKWTIDAVDPSTVLGPFTYRVTFTSRDAQAPLTLSSQVSWLAPTAGSADTQVFEGVLNPLAEYGKITIEPQGTVNDKGDPIPVQVGNSWIWIYAPKDAVAQSVTLTFSRLKIDDASVPQDAKDTWWCALVKIDAAPAVKVSKPILIGLPTRQVLTVGMAAQALTRSGNDAWKALPSVQAMRIAGAGNLAEVMLIDSFTPLLAVGVSKDSRNQGQTGVPISGGFQGGFQGGGFQGGFQGGGGFQMGGFQGFQGIQLGGCQNGFQGGGGFQGGFQGTGGC